MKEGAAFSPQGKSFSGIRSDEEDWAEDEPADGVSHYLPTKEVEACKDNTNTNMFLRTGRQKAGRRSYSSKIYSRKFYTGPNCNDKEEILKADSQEVIRVCTWEVDQTSNGLNNRATNTSEKRLAGLSFLNRPFKIAKSFKGSPEGLEVVQTEVEGENQNSLGGVCKPSTVRIHSRDDGTTVITASHQQKDKNDSKRSKGNAGWGKNFVRLNLKKKNTVGQVKGARRFTKKKSKWKSEPLRQVGDGSNYLSGWEQRQTFRCYNCGESGHFASACSRQQGLDDGNSDNPIQRVENVDIGRIDAPLPVSCGPLYEWNTTGDLLHLLKIKFGHTNFRGNQLEIMTRILNGKSCLNIMPTGMGKSLCYQLPAFYLSGPVVVISPLIALMQDQCEAAPVELNPSILWSGQSTKEALETLNELKLGKIRLLFISPERATNEHFLEAIQPWLPLELLVIDEAHCISEWGHSFRPSYYRLGKVIRSELPSKSVLALTATATLATENCITSILDIPEENKFKHMGIHDKMSLRVEKIDVCLANFEKWQKIAQKLRPILCDTERAIVYCSFRKDADNLSKALALLSIRAKSYHSGILSSERKKILSSFSSGGIRVVVATTAFGMGINISAVDAVIHVSMPRSLEEYVQQIGRAGRNGGNAQCICYLNRSDFLTLRSLCSNPHIRRGSICTVINSIFGDLKIGEYGTIDLKKLLDGQIPEETVESIICYLENQHSGLLTYLGTVPIKARISFYAKCPEEMEESIVTSILKVCPRPRQGVYHVRVADLCSETGDTPAQNFRELAAMSQRSSIGFQPSKEKGVCYRIEQLTTFEQRQELTDEVTHWMERMNSMMTYKLDVAHKAFQVAAISGTNQDVTIRSIINRYFSCPINDFDEFLDGMVSSHGGESEFDSFVKKGGPETLIAAKAVLRRAKEHNLDISASEISCILHGRFNGIDKKKSLDKIMNVFWGRLQDVDHKDVLSAAEAVMSEQTN